MSGLVPVGRGGVFGAMRALVVDNGDPEARQRLRLKIPSLFGDTLSDWVWPAHPVNQIPLPGTPVLVFAEEGSPDALLWLGAPFGAGATPLRYGTARRTATLTPPPITRQTTWRGFIPMAYTYRPMSWKVDNGPCEVKLYDDHTYASMREDQNFLGGDTHAFPIPLTTIPLLESYPTDQVPISLFNAIPIPSPPPNPIPADIFTISITFLPVE